MQAIRSTLCIFEKRARAVAILETVSTTFEGLEHEDGTLTGKYFNRIIGDLKRFNVWGHLKASINSGLKVGS